MRVNENYTLSLDASHIEWLMTRLDNSKLTQQVIYRQSLVSCRDNSHDIAWLTTIILALHLFQGEYRVRRPLRRLTYWAMIARWSLRYFGAARPLQGFACYASPAYGIHCTKLHGTNQQFEWRHKIKTKCIRTQGLAKAACTGAAITALEARRFWVPSLLDVPVAQSSFFVRLGSRFRGCGTFRRGRRRPSGRLPFSLLRRRGSAFLRPAQTLAKPGRRARLFVRLRQLEIPCPVLNDDRPARRPRVQLLKGHVDRLEGRFRGNVGNGNSKGVGFDGGGIPQMFLDERC